MDQMQKMIQSKKEFEVKLKDKRDEKAALESSIQGLKQNQELIMYEIQQTSTKREQSYLNVQDLSSGI